MIPKTLYSFLVQKQIEFIDDVMSGSRTVFLKVSPDSSETSVMRFSDLVWAEVGPAIDPYIQDVIWNAPRMRGRLN